MSPARRLAFNMKELLIRLVVGVAVIVVVVIAATWVAADDLTEPANRDITIGRPPLDLEASNITFASGSGSLIHGWLSHGKPGQGAIILLHGLRGDRRDMVSRAEFLRARGYSVLLFDFQGHGESRGSRITFGDIESRDVTASIQYLHHKLPNEQVGVIGASLGAAAFVLAEGRPAVAVVVLEQMYPTIQQAVAGRARQYLGPLGPVFAPLLMAQMQARLEIPANRLRPIDRMAQLGAPVLIVNGTQDSYTPIEDARALFAAASDPKELWAVQGAGHVNLYAFAKAHYEQRVGDFLGRYLPRNPP
ncbi:MAG: esterase/lipase/thioesterase family active site protein [Gammaproteobacteria bacterium]|nr:esterase/lipase/thioesterase family active site protein [Gammaproteobacteria bacterium]